MKLPPPFSVFLIMKDLCAMIRKESMRPGNTLLVTHGGVIDVILCIENGNAYTNKCVHYRVDHAGIIRAV